MFVERDYLQLSALLADFLKPLGMNVDRGPLRVLRELVAGIVFTGSVQLTNAARLFCHDSAQLADAVERMSHHLADPDWNHDEWAAAVMRRLTEPIEEFDLIPIDETELAKPYARRMQHLCVVRDASRVGDPLVNGYWCFGAHHWSPAYDTLTPLMLRPYSPNRPGYLSENDLITRWFWTLRQATGGRGVWLIDRGADRPEILSALLRVQRRWIVRLREDRRLLGPDGSIRSAGAWADWALANRPHRGNAVTLKVSLPADNVRQYANPPILWLIVPTYTFVRNGKPDRWVLLSAGLIDDHAGPRQVRYHYALRWRAEDAKRFLGQSWHLEKFLTRSFVALERMLWCVCLAGGFLATLQQEEPDWSRRLTRCVTYWELDPNAPKIPSYRLARGLCIAATQAGRGVVAGNA